MKRKITWVGLVVAVAAAVAAAAAFAINGGQLPDNQTSGHVVVQGIEGGDPGSTAIAVKSWSWSVTNTTDSGGGGGGAGRATLKELSIVKTVDKASPSLALACATGRHIPSVVLTVDRPGGSHGPYFEITLTDVLVTGVHPSGVDQDIPLEEVSFSYGRIEWKYTTTAGEIVDAEFINS